MRALLIPAALFASALALLAGPASAAPATKPCPKEPAVRCGSIKVPLLRGAPNGGASKLKVKFRVYPRTDRSRPALEPIVATEGGPGYSTFESAESYLFLLGPLRQRHDMIVMDNRGTGTSGAINCPRLQKGKGVYSREVGRCAKRLGKAANAYGTGAATDDLAAVLDKLGVPKVNIYGDSYGTYFSQTFAVRHPERVRAVILDAAYPVEGLDVWVREETIALRRAWPAACERAAGCDEDVLGAIGRWAVELDRNPLVATGRDADGARHKIRLDGASFGQMTGDGSYYYTIYRDLLAALRAYERGDPEPLVRIASEDLPFTGGGPVKSYSEGAYAAVACHDYPTIWDVSAPIPERRRQYAAARAGLAPDTYAPFPNDIWLNSLYIDQYVNGCIEWPAPRYPDPPVPPGATYPNVPVLVLNGDLDLITPLGDSQLAANLFPNSTLVVVPNVGHVTALADYPGCVSGIVRRFVTTLSPGDTSCVASTPEVHVVPDFPKDTASAPEASKAAAADRSTPPDRRAAWGAAWAVGDAVARWWLMYGSEGHGLRGGKFTTTGDYLAYGPVGFELRGVRFVPDLAVRGDVEWNRRDHTVSGNLRLRGAVKGRLAISWSTIQPGAMASLTGKLGGRRVRLVTPAP